MVILAAFMTTSTFAAARGKTQTLEFGWQPGMTCDVEQTFTSEDPAIGVERARLKLDVSDEQGSLVVRFTGYQIISSTARDAAELRTQQSARGRALFEREFKVTHDGKFISAEPVETALNRIREAFALGDRLLIDVGLRMTNQEVLDSDYRVAWKSLAGNWSNLRYVPGVEQSLPLEEKARLFSEDPNVPSLVTVNETGKCGAAELGVPCVRITNLFIPGSRKGSAAAAGFFRHKVLTELEVESNTLIPHSWSEETRMFDPIEGNRTNQERLTTRIERRFDCRPGS